MAPSPAFRTLEQISAALLALAVRLRPHAGPHRPVELDAHARWTITRAVHDLELHLPGLRTFGHPGESAAALAECQELLASGHPGAALVSALDGLSGSPHHPELHYAAAAAALENGAVTEALLLLRHTLWLKPSHSGALADLDAMFASGLAGATSGVQADDGDCRPARAAHDARLGIEFAAPEDLAGEGWPAEDTEAA